jgi:hypothetical protein
MPKILYVEDNDDNVFMMDGREKPTQNVKIRHPGGS